MRTRTWLKQPLVQKMLAVKHRYWALKSTCYYHRSFLRCGRGTVIYDPLMIAHPECMDLGENVLIRDGVRLEAVLDPYGRKPCLTIGPDTNIEQNVHIICHNRITIGANVSITGNCAIVDVTHPFRDVNCEVKVGSRIADQDSFVEIGDGAFLGYGSVVLPNVRIGHHAVIGANSVVTRDVPPFSVAAGAPATVLETFDFERGEWRKLNRVEGK